MYDYLIVGAGLSGSVFAYEEDNGSRLSDTHRKAFTNISKVLAVRRAPILYQLR